MSIVGSGIKNIDEFTLEAISEIKNAGKSLLCCGRSGYGGFHPGVFANPSRLRVTFHAFILVPLPRTVLLLRLGSIRRVQKNERT